ncbi:ankyrin [Piromyces finnis]|uniref:Ankyrin n=1 Tax=Piromyces finnis TaxID=1754191 RepID=A0A1Y1UX17_9FUNG|nr:ankyrin [Piromyces finnis]|eukprot:ORX42191.1 ankyrin [Piromyces finnis]
MNKSGHHSPPNIQRKINYEDDQGGIPLILACQNGDLTIVKYLISEGANINQNNKNHDTPLTVTCKNWKEEVIHYLIDQGANVNQENKNGDTPLMIICKNCNNSYKSFYSQAYLDIVKHLVDKGADINKNDINHNNVLDIAYNKIHKYKAKVVKYLIDNGAVIHETICTKIIIDTCEQSNLETLKSLVKRNIDVNVEDDNGNTPLLISCRQDNGNNFSIVEYLIAHGANIDQTNKHGDSALIIACQSENEKIVNYLIELGADINKQNKDGDTASIKVCDNGNISIIYQLIEKGANIMHENKDGDTPLLTACKNCNNSDSENYFKIIKKLLEKGAGIDVNKSNRNGETALLAACKRRYRKSKIVNYNYKDENNKEVQKQQSYDKNDITQNYVKILNLLMEQGANINVEDVFGNTPLHASCRRTNYKLLFHII